MGAGQAYATYADYATENPSEQGLGEIGDPIYAQDIPDGVYEVPARTSSNMCIMYRTEEDANAHSGKEMCYVVVENGVMTAVFYISNMYNRLYLGGTGEQAAALTNADGTDDSAYLRGDPADGYVPHLFTMQIPALNYPMNFASFAGGNYAYDPDPNSGWNTRAKWYTRTVVFKPTNELLQAVEAAKSGEPVNGDPEGDDPNGGDPENGDPNSGDPDNGDPNGGDPDDGNPDNGDPNSDDPNGGNPDNGDPDDGKADNDDKKNDNAKNNDNDDDPDDKNQPSGSQNDNSDSNTPTNTNTASESQPAETPEPEPVPAPTAASEESVQSAAPVVRHGILITPATLELELKDTQQQTDMPEMIDVKPKGLSPVQIAALIVGGLICAGIILRFVLFRASRR